MDDYPSLLADAVRTSLANLSAVDSVPGTPSGSILVERAELPVLDLEDLDNLTVTVLDGEDQGEVADRKGRHYQREIEIVVTLQQRIDGKVSTADGKTKIRSFKSVVATALSHMRSSKTDAQGNQYTPIRYNRIGLDRDQLRELESPKPS